MRRKSNGKETQREGKAKGWKRKGIEKQRDGKNDDTQGMKCKGKETRFDRKTTMDDMQREGKEKGRTNKGMEMRSCGKVKEGKAKGRKER